MENQGKSVYEKGRKDKTKIKEVEENWKSVEMERVAEKSSYWTRAMAWLQQLATHTHTFIPLTHLETLKLKGCSIANKRERG